MPLANAGTTRADLLIGRLLAFQASDKKHSGGQGFLNKKS
jgi:hypothetical protein